MLSCKAALVLGALSNDHRNSFLPATYHRGATVILYLISRAGILFEIATCFHLVYTLTSAKSTLRPSLSRTHSFSRAPLPSMPASCTSPEGLCSLWSGVGLPAGLLPTARGPEPESGVTVNDSRKYRSLLGALGSGVTTDESGKNCSLFGVPVSGLCSVTNVAAVPVLGSESSHMPSSRPGAWMAAVDAPC